jgi:hypothetical protein
MEDRTFKMGGGSFRWRELHYTEGSKLWEQYTAPAENGDRAFLQDAEKAIETILFLLEPESKAEFKKLMARKTDPVPRHQIMQLYHWLFSVVTGPSTAPPSDSGTGGGTTEAGSSAKSSSKAAIQTA